MDMTSRREIRDSILAHNRAFAVMEGALNALVGPEGHKAGCCANRPTGGPSLSPDGLGLLSNRLGFISRRKEAEHAGKLARQTNVIASSLERPVGQLSGDNQQKVVFARSLCESPLGNRGALRDTGRRCRCRGTALCATCRNDASIAAPLPAA
jgi:hypothetical protein